jgi:hypothetical protein
VAIARLNTWQDGRVFIITRYRASIGGGIGGSTGIVAVCFCDAGVIADHNLVLVQQARRGAVYPVHLLGKKSCKECRFFCLHNNFIVPRAELLLL